MNPALIAALATTLAGLGILLIITGIRRTADRPSQRRATTVLPRIRRGTVIKTAAGLTGGILVAAATGWVAAIPLIPLAVLGLPWLLAVGPSRARINKIEATGDWARRLAGIMQAGVGIEQAIITSLKSANPLIRNDLARLVSRIHAGVDTQTALRAMADDIDDPTGDKVIAAIILGVQQRGGGLAMVLTDLASTIEADVAMRREIEAEWDKQRNVSRAITVISLVMLVLLLATPFASTYRTPGGQLLFLVLMGGYIAVLVWLRAMTQPKPLPRFLQGQQR